MKYTKTHPKEILSKHPLDPSYSIWQTSSGWMVKQSLSFVRPGQLTGRTMKIWFETVPKDINLDARHSNHDTWAGYLIYLFLTHRGDLISIGTLS